LNHVIDDVAEIYDGYDYAAEKRAALEICASAILRVDTGQSQRGPLLIISNGPLDRDQ
jgi:hypothetical protein